jgi:hypothetical protein
VRFRATAVWPPVIVVAVGAVALAAAACPAASPAPVPPRSPHGEVGPPPPAGHPAGTPCDRAAECESGVCEGQGCEAGQGVCAESERVCTRDLAYFCGCDGETFQGSSSCPGARFESRGPCPQAAPSGAPCLAGADCESGVCEGMGCGDDQPGVCAARERGCTRDLRPFCGCDGETFRASSSCPGRRYAHPGPCGTQTRRAEGASCLRADECESGVCEGMGCGDDQPGTCVSRKRPCTADMRPYCGCDGVTFHGSSTCPGRRYQSRAECTPSR